MSVKATFLSVLCLCLVSGLGAQEDYYDKNDLSYYFQDGGVSTARIVVKTDLLSAVIGNPAIQVEYHPFQRVSVEFGAGITGLYHFNSLNAFMGFTNIGLIQPLKPKPSFHVMPKVYYHGNEGLYNGLKYRYRAYEAQALEESMFRHEFLLFTGFTERFNNHFVNDVSFGFGVLLEEVRLINGTNQRTGFVLSIGIKPGLWL